MDGNPDLCPVCLDFPKPDFDGCSCWLCGCLTTNPTRRMVCSCGRGRPDDVASVIRQLAEMAAQREGQSHYVGELVTLSRAIEFLRTHALPSDHPFAIE